ncbi:unnamed protein product, partial [Anisakis simplex]|uniref:Uncharacterized protein n=1 Tax=Anisakis simplex TaxID=6269 RepID=A0A0M3JPJ4_ANISI
MKSSGRESVESETESISSAPEDQHSANIFENTA